jgi:hypothetical protein
MIIIIIIIIIIIVVVVVVVDVRVDNNFEIIFFEFFMVL